MAFDGLKLASLRTCPPLAPKIPPDARLVDVDKTPLGQRVPGRFMIVWSGSAISLTALARPDVLRRWRWSQPCYSASPTDGQVLRRMLHALGEATVADALPASDASSGDLIELAKRKPGPRSGKGSR